MLALTLACALAAAPQLVVDVPVSLSATSASSGVATTLTPFVGLRGAALFVDDGGGVVGGDLALQASSSTSGGLGDKFVNAPVAGFERRLLLVEPRLLWGHTWQRGALAVTPLLSFSAVAGASMVRPFAGADSVERWQGAWGVRGGAGLRVVADVVSVGVDVAAGVRDGRPEVTSAIAFGFAL